MNAPTRQAESTALTTADGPPQGYAVGPSQTSALMLNAQLMQQMMAVADAMARATITVPVHFRDKPGDCLAVVMQATQWNMNPFAVAQKTHVVNGTLGYEAQLVHAVLQATGAIEGTFSYEYQGDNGALQCRVGATCKGDRVITWGEWLAVSQVTTKNSPLWKTNPKQQIGYLQVKNWARAFKPGAILGVYSTDELEAAAAPEKNMGPADVVGAPPAPPATYPADQFAKNLEAWHSVITSGRKTADQIIAMAETKHPLTDDQKARVRAAPKAAPAADDDGVIVMTFAQVADRINKAATLDKLAEAGSLIPTVADEKQRAELVALYDRRGTEINA